MAAAAVVQLRRVLSSLGALLFAVRAWLVFWTIVPVVWVITACMTRPATAWHFSRRAAGLFFAAAGIRLKIVGLEHLPAEGGSVLVANYASYIDGMALVAALPRPHRFVAKRELTGYFVSRIFLRRLGAVFVERFSAGQSIEDARLLAGLCRDEPLAFFPEGTFTRAPGLGPFRLGAFAASSSAQVPVVPVALRGTRSVFRASEWLPRHGEIAVTVYSPIRPPADAASDFERTVRLSDAARAAILQGCGEHDAIRS